MDNIKSYIRKNLVFVGLLSVLILITIGLSIFLLNRYEPDTTPVTPEPTPSEKTPAKITSLEGDYGKDAQVRISWSIAKNDDTITSVKLYNKETQLGGEMKSMNSFPLPQSVYRFPTGKNEFTLKVSVEDGEDIVRNVTVFIDYVLDVQMNAEQNEEGDMVKLSYSYGKDTSVGVPRIQLRDTNSQPFELFYVDTVREEHGDFVNATTTYRIMSNQVVKGIYEINIRWIFDGVNSSYDFPFKITK